MKKTIDELRAALKSSVVEFTFTKLNGELRKAKGTTNPGLIPSEHRSASTKKPSSKVLVYFDFNVNGFRSISVGSNISF